MKSTEIDIEYHFRQALLRSGLEGKIPTGYHRVMKAFFFEAFNQAVILFRDKATAEQLLAAIREYYEREVLKDKR
jgi:hypothetical protein